MTDLTAVIDCLGGSETFEVVRPQGGQRIDGEFVRAAPRRFPADGAWQPADGKTLLMLPEGVRSRETWVVWTDCELFNANVPLQREADILQRNDIEFEVMVVRDWFTQGGYNRATVVRLGQ